MSVDLQTRSSAQTLISWLIAGCFIFLLASIFSSAHAHPEDEICGPDSAIDRELCRQLSALDKSTGELTHPLLDDEGNVRTAFGSGLYFLEIGVRHILPGGLDHILFVLALFLASKNLRSLILQISVFTIAHTVTLGLTASGVIEPPASIVEPLIALSIAVVALEVIFQREVSKWRLLVIFGFGLFHGMGFAGFISGIGLPTEQFWPSLIGFNIGVEIGQLAVVALAVLISIPLKRVLTGPRYSYRNVVTLPASVLITVIGLYWFATRILG